MDSNPQHGPPVPPEDDIPPEVLESVRQLRDTGRASYGAGKDAVKAFRSLLAADVSLARSAFGRTLAFTGVAIAFGASAWLLAMAALVVWLIRVLGWPWSGSLLASAVVSLLVTGFATWRAITYFEHTRMKATRRQLARLGVGELAKYTPEPGSAASTRQVTEQVAPKAANGEPAKDSRGIEVTPP